MRDSLRNVGEKPREACGVFGISGHPEAAKLSCLGLHALQHRGQESAGIATVHDRQLLIHKGMGLVNEVFDSSVLVQLPGSIAIGHTRYSTAGSSTLANAQPILVDCNRGPIAVGHNGNITNAIELRKRLERSGSIFQTNSDTEVVLHLIAHSRQAELTDAIAESLIQLRGAFSLLILTADRLYAIRDPHGFRPLSIGRIAGVDGTDSAIVFASETAALDLVGAQFQRDVEPGEIVVVHSGRLASVPYGPRVKPACCIFELVYFARPDSIVFGRSVALAREQMGRCLAQEASADADIVIPVPDSGVRAALGYSAESGIPFRMGLIRSHYTGRTFIEPEQYARDLAVKFKLSPVRSLIEGKRVVLVDDSIVRGTTSRKIVRMIRDAGASEVHLRVASPPFVAPCPYGIDTPSADDLIAANHAVEEVQQYIGADSLAYLSHAALLQACADPNEEIFCTCCFGGKYPEQQIECNRPIEEEEREELVSSASP